MFDFGGVLVDLDQSKCVEAFVKLGVNNIMDYISKYVQNGLFLDLEKGNAGVGFLGEGLQISYVAAQLMYERQQQHRQQH